MIDPSDMALVHEGQDYATLRVGTNDFQISLALMVALLDIGCPEEWEGE